MVILFSVYLFAEMAYRPLILFKDAGGIWKSDRFRPLITAMANLLVNLILVQHIGLYGIVFSTISSLLFIGFPWLIQKINKHLFKIDVKKYIICVIQYTSAIVLSVATADTIIFYLIKSVRIFRNSLKERYDLE